MCSHRKILKVYLVILNLSMKRLRQTFLIQINCNSEIIYESFVKNLNETIRLLTVFTMHVLDTDHHKETSQLASTCSKSTIETVEKGVKYVQN